jgi:N-acetylmuramoyl-L-alanine amidase
MADHRRRRQHVRPSKQTVARRRFGAVVLLALVLAALGFVVFARRPLNTPARRQAQESDGAVAIDPNYFSTGACMAYPPTHGDQHETVFLDAGHGGIDPGAIGTTETGQTVHEANETLPVELDAMALLRADGFRVVASRTRAETVLRLHADDVSDGVLTLKGAHDDVAARDICANRAKASVLVGIYFDYGGSAQNAGSITTYDPDRSFRKKSLALANLVQRDVLGAMNARGWQIPNGGVMSDATLGSSVPTAPGTGGSLAADAAAYNHLLLLGPAAPGYFSTPSTMPGTVIEPLFVTDPFEATIAASSSGQHVIATGIAKAVETYFSDQHSAKH